MAFTLMKCASTDHKSNCCYVAFERLPWPMYGQYIQVLSSHDIMLFMKYYGMNIYTMWL